MMSSLQLMSLTRLPPDSLRTQPICQRCVEFFLSNSAGAFFDCTGLLSLEARSRHSERHIQLTLFSTIGSLRAGRPCTFNILHVCCMRATASGLRSNSSNSGSNKTFNLQKNVLIRNKAQIDKVRTHLNIRRLPSNSFPVPDAYRIWERKKFAGSL